MVIQIRLQKKLSIGYSSYTWEDSAHGNCGIPLFETGVQVDSSLLCGRSMNNTGPSPFQLLPPMRLLLPREIASEKNQYFLKKFGQVWPAWLLNRRLIAARTAELVLLPCGHYKLFATITFRKTGKNKILILICSKVPTYAGYYSGSGGLCQRSRV